MKVVLDTNILVSAMLTDGPCANIVRLALDGGLHVCFDDRILAEYEEVLPRPKLKIRPQIVTDLLTRVKAAGERILAAPLSMPLPDPTDRPFLEVAAAGGAVLVTGNARHFPKSARAGVTVMTPGEFIDSLRRPD